MNKKSTSILLLIFIGFIGYFQSTFYVSPSGNNDNSGTEGQPFLTINKTISSFDVQGGTCFIFIFN